MNGSRWRHRLQRWTTAVLAAWIAVVAVGQPLWANSVCECRCVLCASDQPPGADDSCCDPSQGSAQGSTGSCGHASASDCCCCSPASDDANAGELTSSSHLPTTGRGLLCRAFCAGCRAVREDARTTSRPAIEPSTPTTSLDVVLAVRPTALALVASGNQLDRERRELVALRPPFRVTYCIWRE